MGDLTNDVPVARASTVDGSTSHRCYLVASERTWISWRHDAGSVDVTNNARALVRMIVDMCRLARGTDREIAVIAVCVLATGE
jgi:2-methylaconitate cis-trans-isomerase PrpF